MASAGRTDGELEVAEAKKRIADLKRKLFRSPVVDMVDSESDRSPDASSSNNALMTLMTKLELEQDAVEVGHKLLQKDQHEQRLKQLRQKGKALSEDDWQYENVDQLIGLQ